jgi:putative SOS response-associated peptidase YedK
MIAETFGLDRSAAGAADFPERYNIAPGQDIAAVICGASGRSLESFRWGFVPAWSMDDKKGLINARAETAALKPTFRDAFRRRRCLIIADGFYEWQRGKTKKPFFITLLEGRPFCMAGIYETSPREGVHLTTCAILTVAANSLVGRCHDRMPAIIPRDFQDVWLTPGTDIREIEEILKPYPDRLMKMHEVSPLVNSPRIDSPRCIEPVGPSVKGSGPAA